MMTSGPAATLGAILTFRFPVARPQGVLEHPDYTTTAREADRFLESQEQKGRLRGGPGAPPRKER